MQHVVLNAKYHESEAEIVAQAGRKGVVTIATNMAGRGTDILLGGNAEFMAKQECMKKGMAQRLQRSAVRCKPGENRTFTLLLPGMSIRCRPRVERRLRTIQGGDRPRTRRSDQAGWSAHPGTERHEARRIDNQLRGRAGRQGDPGSSRFYLSLEDDLMRIFAKEWVSNLLQRLGMEEGVPIESKTDHPAHRGRAEGGGSPELRIPQTPA